MSTAPGNQSAALYTLMSADTSVSDSKGETVGHWLQPLLETVLDCISPSAAPRLGAGWHSAETVLNQLSTQAVRWRQALGAIEPPTDVADRFRDSLLAAAQR